MIDTVSALLRMRSFGAALCAVFVASCVSQSSGPAATPAAFVPGQAVEVVPAGPGTCAGTWTTAVSSVPVQASATLDAHKQQLACDMALQRLESDASERCQSNFSDSTLYRNGQLLPLTVGAGDCQCTETNSETNCVVSTTVQCGHEELVCL